MIAPGAGLKAVSRLRELLPPAFRHLQRERGQLFLNIFRSLRTRGRNPGTDASTIKRRSQLHVAEPGGKRLEGYCVKCRAKKEIKNAKAVTMKNGRPATEGQCPDCGTKIFKIGKAG